MLTEGLKLYLDSVITGRINFLSGDWLTEWSIVCIRRPDIRTAREFYPLEGQWLRDIALESPPEENSVW